MTKSVRVSEGRPPFAAGFSVSALSAPFVKDSFAESALLASAPPRPTHPRRLWQNHQSTSATEFGGWPFAEEEVVFPRAAGRFAKHPDGREERPPK